MLRGDADYAHILVASVGWGQGGFGEIFSLLYRWLVNPPLRVCVGGVWGGVRVGVWSGVRAGSVRFLVYCIDGW
jgi:hypothetical protein